MTTVPSPFPASAGLQNPVCVFCGSSPGTSHIYTEAAQSLGKALARARIPVVYGGGRRGIMGVVSSSTTANGGYVHGIVPQALLGRAAEHTPAPTAPGAQAANATPAAVSSEGTGKDLLEDDADGHLTMDVVDSMHEALFPEGFYAWLYRLETRDRAETGLIHQRKLKMARLSTGGFIVLPGGYGTFEEALEMITWNQLGIHRLPIIVLNVGNFYTHLRHQFHAAVEAGFIAKQNLSLVNIVDLPGGAAANADPTMSDQWGDAAIDALQTWSLESSVGYGFAWSSDSTSQPDAPPPLQSTVEKAVEGRSLPQRPEGQPLSLFTTMRFTSPSRAREVTRSDVPLLERHIQRLREAHAHFAIRDGANVWGDYVGDDTLWAAIREKLESTPEGDWRVRVVLHPAPKGIEVQCVPAPSDAGPFQLYPSAQASGSRRPLVLDPHTSILDEEGEEETDCRLYKTTRRQVYDQAAQRVSGAEVLLHTDDLLLLETNTSNVAFWSPQADGGPRWATPRLHRREAAFLDGVMRRHLLEARVMREEDLTIGDWERAKRDGVRVIGFNGLRGVWEAELR